MQPARQHAECTVMAVAGEELLMHTFDWVLLNILKLINLSTIYLQWINKSSSINQTLLV